MATGEQTLDDLISLLGSSDWQQARYAVEELARCGADALPPLLAALPACHDRARLWIVDALVEIGRPAVEGLMGLLGHEDARVRGTAAMTLGRIGDRRAVTPLMRMLRDGSAWVRLWAATALGQLGEGDERVVAALLAHLSDPGDDATSAGVVRDAVAEALIAIGGPAAPRVIGVVEERGRRPEERARRGSRVSWAMGGPSGR